MVTPEIGERVQIPAALLEFNVGSKTIWIQSPEGATILRIKCTGTISVDMCKNSPTSHADADVQGDIHFCLSEDIEHDTGDNG